MTRITMDAARLLAFTLLQGICFAVLGALVMAGSELTSSGGAAVAEATPDPVAALAGLGSLLAMVALQGLSLQFLAGRMGAGQMGDGQMGGGLGRRIAVAFAVAFLIGTVLSQIDSFIFLADFRGDLGVRIVAMGFVNSLSAALLAGLLFRPATGQGGGIALPASMTGWAIVLCLAALFHILVYFVFGYWVVWVDAEARAFYGGGDLVPFAEHMAGVARETLWFFPVQFLRGLIWAGVAALAFAAMRTGRLGAGLIVLALFLAYGVAPLLVPNPLMPWDLRQLHIIELALTAVAMAGAAHVLFRPWGGKAG